MGGQQFPQIVRRFCTMRKAVKVSNRKQPLATMKILQGGSPHKDQGKPFLRRRLAVRIFGNCLVCALGALARHNFLKWFC
jgi:hypothetical protein